MKKYVSELQMAIAKDVADMLPPGCKKIARIMIHNPECGEEEIAMLANVSRTRVEQVAQIMKRLVSARQISRER
jgi:hypothetical protein